MQVFSSSRCLFLLENWSSSTVTLEMQFWMYSFLLFRRVSLLRRIAIASPTCLERQSLYCLRTLILKVGLSSRSGCAFIQCFTMWEFLEKDSASSWCSAALSAKDLLVSPMYIPTLPREGSATCCSSPSWWGPSSWRLDCSGLAFLSGLHRVHLDS